MKSLRLLLTVIAFSSAFAEASRAAEPLPAQYSFNDLYRLTVGQSPLGATQPAAETVPVQTGVRVAMSAAAAAAEPRFTVRPFPAPERWLLVLAGLALAGWLAHRRLSYL